MDILVWFVTAILFLSLIVSSNEVSYETNLKEIQNSLKSKSKSFQFNNITLTRMIPNLKQALQNILEKHSRYATKDDIAIINDYVDEFLRQLNEYLRSNSIDPLPLKDLTTGFEFTFILITYWAEMSLRNGWLHGASTLQRRGNAILKYESPNIIIHASAGFKKLTFSYDYLINYMDIGVQGDIYGRIDDCPFSFDLVINERNLQAKVDKFRLDILGEVSLRFNGLTWLDWFVNLCARIAVIGVKPILRRVIEDFILNILNSLCEAYNNFVCQILDNCPKEYSTILL